MESYCYRWEIDISQIALMYENSYQLVYNNFKYTIRATDPWTKSRTGQITGNERFLKLKFDLFRQFFF